VARKGLPAAGFRDPKTLDFNEGFTNIICIERRRFPMKFDLTSRTFIPAGSDRVQAMAGMPLGSFRARAAAWFMDIAVVIGLLIGVTAIRALFGAGALIPKEGTGSIHIELFEDPVGIGLYFGLLPRLWNGRTVGKRVFGLRIVSLSHDRLTLWQCIERALGYAFSSLEGGFGFLQYFLHPNRQTVHDRIAETVVIREKRRKGSGMK
jgi:uncharacterized RDD family membrane protein YckC